MQPSKSVEKSKSSSSALKTKNRDKKSWSTPGFPETDSKKRGVYVERHQVPETNDNNQNADASKTNSKKTSDSRGFIDAVNSILNKDTSSSQCPEVGDFRPGRPRKIKRRLGVVTVDKGTQDFDSLFIVPPSKVSSSTPKQKSFRSRILRKLNEQTNPCEIIQARKELTHTPSNHSDIDCKRNSMLKIKDENEPPQKKEEKNDLKEKNEGKKKKPQEVDEPTTLVSEYKNTRRKSMYNFFVDLLETTINVYNGDCNKNHSVSKVSSDKMAINESVADQLNLCNVKRDNNTIDNRSAKKDEKFYICRNVDISTDKIEVYKTKPNITNINPPLSPKGSIRRSLSYRNLKKKKRLHVKSMNMSTEVMPKRERRKKSKKQTLLSILKEELQMDDDAFEEPQNMHEALKIIAKNKRRCRRTIHFDDSINIKKTKNDSKPDCVFKRRKIISSSNKSSKRNRKFRLYNPQTTFMTSILTSKLPRKFSTPKTAYYQSSMLDEEQSEHSDHSLEVQAYDYDVDNITRNLDVNKYNNSDVTSTYCDINDMTSDNEFLNYRALQTNDSFMDDKTALPNKKQKIDHLFAYNKVQIRRTGHRFNLNQKMEVKNDPLYNLASNLATGNKSYTNENLNRSGFYKPHIKQSLQSESIESSKDLFMRDYSSYSYDSDISTQLLLLRKNTLNLV